jgi:hypothetical protein
MDNTLDLLQIKIENAKKQLPEETLAAIAAVPWQAEIIKMRETRGYSFEQLGDLELETELLLCGLLSPKDYPKELQNRMKISAGAANDLMEEMNKLVFSKIKEELIKGTEGKKIVEKETNQEEENIQIFKNHGIEILGESDLNPPLLAKEGAGGGNLKEEPPRPSGTPPQKGGEETLPVPEKLEIGGSVISPSPSQGEGLGVRSVPTIMAQKMSGPVQTETVQTEHSLENITKTNTKVGIPKPDPYREIPE